MIYLVGAGGFIGKHLVALLNKNRCQYQVISIPHSINELGKFIWTLERKSKRENYGERSILINFAHIYPSFVDGKILHNDRLANAIMALISHYSISHLMHISTASIHISDKHLLKYDSYLRSKQSVCQKLKGTNIHFTEFVLDSVISNEFCAKAGLDGLLKNVINSNGGISVIPNINVRVNFGHDIAEEILSHISNEKNQLFETTAANGRVVELKTLLKSIKPKHKFICLSPKILKMLSLIFDALHLISKVNFPISRAKLSYYQALNSNNQTNSKNDIQDIITYLSSANL